MLVLRHSTKTMHKPHITEIVMVLMACREEMWISLADIQPSSHHAWMIWHPNGCMAVCSAWRGRKSAIGGWRSDLTHPESVSKFPIEVNDVWGAFLTRITLKRWEEHERDCLNSRGITHTALLMVPLALVVLALLFLHCLPGWLIDIWQF